MRLTHNVLRLFQQACRPPARPGAPIVVISLPRSGSAFLRNAMTGAVKLPQAQIEVGPRMHGVVDLAVLTRDVAGKRVYAKSHLPATPYNLAALRLAGIRKCVVHVRDPRDALLSWNYQIGRPEVLNDRLSMLSLQASGNSMAPNHHELSKEQQIDWLMEHYYPDLVGWIADWMAILAKPPADLEILATTHAMLREDSRGLVNRILEFFGYSERLDAKALPTRKRGSFENNFRQGKANEHVEAFTPAQREWASRSLPNEWRERFGWAA